MLRSEKYDDWKDVTTTFSPNELKTNDIYAQAKKDILGITPVCVPKALSELMT
jgi:hypothetical protein